MRRVPRSGEETEREQSGLRFSPWTKRLGYPQEFIKISTVQGYLGSWRVTVQNSGTNVHQDTSDYRNNRVPRGQSTLARFLDRAGVQARQDTRDEAITYKPFLKLPAKLWGT